jgi:Flp pilus assembly protein TadG
MKMKRLRSFLGDECGRELLEFALSSTILITMVLGIVDVSRALYVYHFVTHAAQDGARYAMVRGDDWTSSCSTSAPPSFTMTFGCKAANTDVQNYVESLALVNKNNLHVSTTWPQTTPDCSTGCSACATADSKGCMVKVNVQYDFTFDTVFFKQTTVTFSSTSEQVIQQ